MKIFVINLDSSKDRLKNIQMEFKKLHLDFTRIPAIKASLNFSKPYINYNPELNKKTYRRPLSRGEIGCYMSHMRCWQEIVDKKIPIALVLEDDAKLNDQLPDILSSIEEISLKWDIIKLCEPPNPKRILASVPLYKNFHLCQYRKIPSRATGYVISNQGATKLLEVRNFFGRPVDDDMQFYWEFSGVIYGVEPSPIGNSHFGDDSNIDSNEPRQSKKTFLSRFKAPFFRIDYELKLLRHNLLCKTPNRKSLKGSFDNPSTLKTSRAEQR